MQDAKRVGDLQPSCSVGLYFSADPPALPASEARSRSPPKPCSEDIRLSGVPSSFTGRESERIRRGEENRRLTAIVLGRLVLLAGFSRSLNHIDSVFVLCRVCDWNVG